MICANPDIMVERGDELIYCAGALAADYEAEGRQGHLRRQAAPADLPAHASREIAQLKGAPVPKEQILAIGDGLETDLLGAHGAGLRSVFIASPIFVPDGLEPVSDELFADGPCARRAAGAGLVGRCRPSVPARHRRDAGAEQAVSAA